MSLPTFVFTNMYIIIYRCVRMEMLVYIKIKRPSPLNKWVFLLQHFACIMYSSASKLLQTLPTDFLSHQPTNSVFLFPSRHKVTRRGEKYDNIIDYLSTVKLSELLLLLRVCFDTSINC